MSTLLANLKAAARVRKLLLELEADTNLVALSIIEREALYAAVDVTQTVGDVVTSPQIKTHPVTAEQSTASLYRALEGLLEKGYLIRPVGRRRGGYIVTDQIRDPSTEPDGTQTHPEARRWVAC